MKSSVGVLHDKAELPPLAVGWQPEFGERLVRRIVPGTDFQHLASFIRSRYLAAKLLCDAYHLLYLLNRAHALARLAPEVILVADPHVDAECHCHGRVRRYRPPQRLVRRNRALGGATHPLHEVEGVTPAAAGTADGRHGVIQR